MTRREIEEIENGIELAAGELNRLVRSEVRKNDSEIRIRRRIGEGKKVVVIDFSDNRLNGKPVIVLEVNDYRSEPNSRYSKTSIYDRDPGHYRLFLANMRDQLVAGIPKDK